MLKLVSGTFLLVAACVIPAMGGASQSPTTSNQPDQSPSETGVTPADLQAFLPESLPGGFSRVSAQSGIKQNAPGAVGVYEISGGENDSGEQLELVIFDIVAMDNPRDYTVRERVLFQMEADYHSETEETTLAGHPAFEEPRDEIRQDMLVLVGERLVVKASSGSLGNDALREALSALDWKRIAGLANGSDVE